MSWQELSLEKLIRLASAGVEQGSGSVIPLAVLNKCTGPDAAAHLPAIYNCSAVLIHRASKQQTAAQDPWYLLLRTPPLCCQCHQSPLADLLLNRDARVPGCPLPQHIHSAVPHHQLRHRSCPPALPAGVRCAVPRRAWPHQPHRLCVLQQGAPHLATFRCGLHQHQRAPLHLHASSRRL